MSYCAGWPVPSPTSVKERVTEVPVTPATARLFTVPGFPATAVTVIVAVPFFPSLVAVIVAAPAATPVTTPLPFTVATAVLPLAQVTTRPASGFPLASLAVAVSCTVCPTGRLAVAGLTATDATGTAVTVIPAVPLWPSLVAVMVAAPAATPVTSPLPFTVATAVLLLPQVTTRPASGFPLASFGVAVSCAVCPTGTLADAGATVTDATGTLLTVSTAVPFLPSLVAVMVPEPTATPVARPLAFTVATAVLLLAHVTTRPARANPLASFGIAVNCAACPTITLAVAGLTVTDATGSWVTVMAAVPLWPSLVAVLGAAPAATPVTTPLALTAAAAALLLAHVTVRPLSTFPTASFVVAESATVWPTCSLTDTGLTVTDATGADVTVTAAVSVVPPPWATTLTFPVSGPALFRP